MNVFLKDVIVIISCIWCHLSIHLILYSFIYCFDLNFFHFQFKQNGNSIDEHRHYRKKTDTAGLNSSSLFPFALLGHPHLSYHILPVNELIHRGIGFGSSSLYLGKCAKPKNDNLSLCSSNSNCTIKPKKFQ